MSQHDYIIDDQNGLEFLEDLNEVMAAIVTNNSGATEPATRYARMRWDDTTTGLRKQRNAANNGWIVRGTIAETLVLARSSNTIIGVGDYGRTIIATSTFTQTLTAAGTLGDGFVVQYRNNGTGVITLDPDGSETIDGNTTLILYPGQSCVIYSNGSTFYTIGRNGDTHYAVASGTDTYTATLAPIIAAYITGRTYNIKFTNANTSTTPTINLNSLGAKTMVRANGAVLGVGEIEDDMVLRLTYDGTNMVATNFTASTTANVKVPVRQCVLSSLLNSSGQAAAVSIGADLDVDLDADPTAFTLTFAGGFDSNGAVDYVGHIDSDQTSYWEDLAANSVTFLAINRNTSTGALTSYKTLNLPQYGYAFDRTAQALLHFEGSDASTTFLDDWGNTWTANGNAQIDTAQFKFGTSSLLLDGTGDYASSTSFSTLYPNGADGFTVEGWVRFTALPTSGNRMSLFTSCVGTTNASGLELVLLNDAGTYKLELYASSNGSSADLINGTAATVTTPSTDTWYHWAATYDPVSGHFRTYWDGTAAHAVASTGKIAGSTSWKLGMRADGVSSGINGHVDEFRFTPACLYPAGTAFTPSAAAFTVASVPHHFFSIPQMTMYEVTSASASAGTDPGMTAVQRVFIGEATTGTATVDSVRSYAVQGRYRSALTAFPASGTEQSFTHNIGVHTSRTRLFGHNLTTQGGYQNGNVLEIATAVDAAQGGIAIGSPTRHTSSFTMNSGPLFIHRGSSSIAVMTLASWKCRVEVDRGW